MSITIQWDNPEQTALIITYVRPWTWKEFDAALEQMLTMFDSVTHKVDVIFDVRSAGFPPPDAISHFKRAAEIQHPNGGLLIYIAPKVIVQFINSIVRILRVAFEGSGRSEAPKFIFTQSPEEARALLLAHRTVKAG